MKAFGILPLALMGIGLAASAPTSNVTAPSPVHSLEIDCSFVRKIKPATSVFMLPKGVAAREEPSPPAPTLAADDNTVTAKDVSIKTSIRRVTSDRGIPDNLHRVHTSFSKYCDNQPDYVMCNSKDYNTNRQITGRDPIETVTPATPIENTTFELASATITLQPEFTTHAAGEVIDAQASTVIFMPAIIETAHPNPTSRQAQIDVILPFHLQIWEYCGLHGERFAAGVYTNGNMKQSIDLEPGLMTSINHRVPGYGNLAVGPFDYEGSRVRFGYGGCEWWDHETWKSCGECRAGLWSGEPIDCREPRSTRYKDMDCSVLLGTKMAAEM